MLSRKSRKFEKKPSKATDTIKQNASLNTFKKQLYKLEETPECSQLSNQPHKNIGDLIKEKQGDKEACENAFSDLLKRTEEIKKELKNIQKNKKLSREDLVKQQLAIIEKDQYLNGLMLKNISSIEKELGFLKYRREFQREFKAKMCLAEDLSRTSEQENWAGIFHYAGRNIDTVLKHPEPAKLATIESYNRLYSNHFINGKATQQNRLAAKHQDTSGQLVIARYFNNPSIQEAKNIAERRERKKILEEHIQKTKHQQEDTATIFQNAKQKFELVIQKDEKAISLACQETLQAYRQDKNSRSALQILSKAYLEQLKCLQNSKQLSTDEVERTLEEFQTKWNEQEAQMQSKIQSLKEQLKELLVPVKDEDKILKEATDAIVSICNTYNRTTGEYMADAKQLVSFYDFVETNITHRLPNSLDELEKKSREALHLLENEIKELEFLQQSEQSNQAKAAMEQPSPADTLQNHLETSFTDTDMTDQRKHIITSYMRGLFEKSHHQSLDEETIAKFCKENIEEAKQVGTYLEQKHFIHHKIRDEAIKLAVHLKHEFGFPIHDASIDADFNIIKSRLSKKWSAVTSKLEINPQGKILKDSKVQRVYLIGLQDEAKPMALLAIQSGNTSSPKFGAQTPLPTGGVVDVITAQHTRRDQPNLYKATLSLETLQETHGQKEIDMPTLEFFETETVKNYHTKAALYDVTTFAGKVKDRPHSVLPDNSPSDNSKEEKAYQETTGPCMVDLGELLSAVRNIVEGSGRFCPSWKAMMYIKREIAGQVLGKETVPTSDEAWKKNGETCWADFHEYSTSMNMFAKYLAVAYREELGLTHSK